MNLTVVQTIFLTMQFAHATLNNQDRARARINARSPGTTVLGFWTPHETAMGAAMYQVKLLGDPTEIHRVMIVEWGTECGTCSYNHGNLDLEFNMFFFSFGGDGDDTFAQRTNADELNAALVAVGIREEEIVAIRWNAMWKAMFADVIGQRAYYALAKLDNLQVNGSLHLTVSSDKRNATTIIGEIVRHGTLFVRIPSGSRTVMAEEVRSRTAAHYNIQTAGAQWDAPAANDYGSRVVKIYLPSPMAYQLARAAIEERGPEFLIGSTNCVISADTRPAAAQKIKHTPS
jgi:hypothetical protein